LRGEASLSRRARCDSRKRATERGLSGDRVPSSAARVSTRSLLLGPGPSKKATRPAMVGDILTLEFSRIRSPLEPSLDKARFDAAGDSAADDRMEPSRESDAPRSPASRVVASREPSSALLNEARTPSASNDASRDMFSSFWRPPGFCLHAAGLCTLRCPGSRF